MDRRVALPSRRRRESVDWMPAQRKNQVIGNRTTRPRGLATQATARLAAGLLMAVVFAACGGGGGGTNPPPTQNPLPALTSISPTSANAGGAAFTLTVTGSNFISSSRVRWGSADRTTTFVSSTQLTAAISASDIAAGASVNVTVFNPTPGGGTSSPQTLTINNPVPAITSLSPSSGLAGSPTFTLTVNGSSFVPSSVVQWNGVGLTTTFVSGTQLTAAVPPGDIAAAGSASVTVVNPAPAGGTSGAATFAIAAPSPISILTSVLPDTTGGRDYNFTLAATGGIQPYSWSISAGTAPGGLAIDPTSGQISGTVTGVGSDAAFAFTVKATDSATTPNVGTRGLSITVHATGTLGRNDVCTAGTTAGTTPISNGTIRASISPYGDIDVYSFHGTIGHQVTMEIFAQRLSLYTGSFPQDSYLDSMMELLDTNCSLLAFDDDISTGTITDSKISVSATPFPPPCPSPPDPNAPCADVPPATNSLPYTGTYYIRIRDFRGDGRPDFIYDLTLSGAD